MNISEITAEGFVNTDRLENTLVHMINEKKDSEKGPLSYIDTRLFVKKFMDNYVKCFTRSINECYLNTYKSIFSDIATGLEENKDDVNTLDAYKSEVTPEEDLIIKGPEEIEVHHLYCDGHMMF